MNKRAALEISVTGIVVFIIAITILALVLTFINKTFGSLTDTVTGQVGTLKKQLVDSLVASGELVAISTDNIELKQGQPQELVVAIRNTAPSTSDTGETCFRMYFTCETAFSNKNQNTCEFKPNGKQPFPIGGISIKGDTVPPEDTWFQSIEGGGELNIASQQGKPNAVTMRISRGVPDKYRVKLQVFKESKNKDCSNQQEFKEYSTKSFIVSLVQ